MKKILSGLFLFCTIVGVLWAILYAFDISNFARTTSQFLALILASGIIGLTYLQNKNDSEKERLYWIYPGDKILIEHVSGRPNLKKMIGKEFIVDYFAPLSKEIWASSAEHKSYCFKPNEISLISRNTELYKITEKAGTPPKII